MKETLHGRSICIVMMSALGDSVHVLPLICAIKRSAPTARITWVLEPLAARLMTGHPLVDEIVVHKRGARALRDLRGNMRGRNFDILLDLQVAFKAGVATMVIPATRKIGFDKGRARDANWLFTNERIAAHPAQHVQDQYIEFLTHLGVSVEPVEWQLGPWLGEEGLAEKLLQGITRPVVSLAIATSRDEKDWIPASWAELADELYSKHGLQPVLVGGPSEKEAKIASEITAAARCPIVSTLGCTLRELVSVLSASALVVSPDTAPLHMSVALNVPVIALMGFTNPRRVGPWRRSQELLVDAFVNPGEAQSAQHEYRADRMGKIRTEDVLAKVRAWKRQRPRDEG